MRWDVIWLPALLALALALAPALAVAGCGRTTVVPAGDTATVALTEYRLEPQSLRVAPGPVRILARNLGRLAHNLVLSAGNRTLATSPAVAPGASLVFTVSLTAGHYTLGSNLFDDQSLGLYGSLTVSR